MSPLKSPIDSQFYAIFDSYCNFGTRPITGVYTPPKSTIGGKHDEARMDNSKFAKLARELPLIDGERYITMTDVDLAFQKAKHKEQRRLSYNQFKNALGLLADKLALKYIKEGQDKETALCTAKAEIFGKLEKSRGPGLTAGSTRPDTSPLVEKLVTDAPANYVGRKAESPSQRTWKDQLRSPISRRSAPDGTPSPSRKSPKPAM